MAFEKGNKLATGRPAGSLSKRSQAFLDTLQESGINPVKVLLDALKNAHENYDNCPFEKKDVWNSQIIQIAEKMLPYIFPKLSSIEVKGDNPLDNMSPSEKLEA